MLPDALTSHVVSTGALLEAMVRHGVGRLVYASSNHAVGRSPRADLPGGVLGADRHGLDVVSNRIGTFLPAPPAGASCRRGSPTTTRSGWCRPR